MKGYLRTGVRRLDLTREQGLYPQCLTAKPPSGLLGFSAFIEGNELFIEPGLRIGSGIQTPQFARREANESVWFQQSNGHPFHEMRELAITGKTDRAPWNRNHCHTNYCYEQDICYTNDSCDYDYCSRSVANLCPQQDTACTSGVDAA